jgi:hypothetical protein
MAVNSPEELRKFQELPRVAFSGTTPFEVLDVLLSAEKSSQNLSRIYVHFTGNAAGGIHKVSFGGIDAVVMAGANIIELSYQKATPQVIYWVSLLESTLIDTIYIVHLILASGNKSVVFAKPEQRTKKVINILTEKRVNVRRALMDKICTIIFTTAQALQQFIIQFQNAEAWTSQPQKQIGFTEMKASQTIPQIEEQCAHMELNQYKSTNKTFGDQSNVKFTKYTELQASLAQPIVSTRVSIVSRCLIALSALKEEGKQEMDANDFSAILTELCSEMNLQIKV